MLLGVTPLRRFATLFAAILISFTAGVFLLSEAVHAAPGINQTINFQGRLYTSSGATVPDGYYNIEFKIYQDGTGTVAGNPSGSLEWTESHLNANSQGVTVRNGFMSVELGSVSAFGTNVDWNQDTLWLSMNIGNTNGSCTPFASCGSDGEMVPMKRLSAVPYAMNAMQLGGKTAGDFIQNGTAPQTSNFNITGTGTASILQAASLDTAAAGTLTLGGSNATSIALADNTTLGAGLSLTLTGGNTASRPASPTEGMVYYDTTTKQLLTYANGKWQADRSDAVLVAANNSSDADKAAADYIANGNTGTAADGDQVQINDALTAGSGKKVVLLAGTYVVDATILIPNNTTLAGVGNGTVVELADLDATDNLIENSNATTGTGVVIRDMKIDGRNDLNTAGTQYGVRLTNMGDSTTSRAGGVVTNVTMTRFRNFALSINTSDNTTLTNNKVLGGIVGGIEVSSASTHNTISGNKVIGIGNNAFSIAGAHNSVIGNTASGNGGGGFYVQGSNNTFNGNVSHESSFGLVLDNAFDNIISSNRFSDNGGSATNEAIYLHSDSSNNSITSNTITDSSATLINNAINIEGATEIANYLADNTLGGGGIYDFGTGTIYANQLNASGQLINSATTIKSTSNTAFQVQNASGVAQLTADTTNSRITIGSSTTDATAIIFALDNYNQAADPTGIDGAMYYNTNLSKFRCYQNGVWLDCVNTAVSGANTSLSNLTSTNINAALNTTAGDLILQTTTSGNIVLNPVGTIELQKATNVIGSLTATTSVLAPSLDRANAGALLIGNTNATSIVIGNSAGTAGLTLSSSSVQIGIATSATTLQASAQTTSNTQGSSFTVQGANGNGTGNGGTLNVQGGNGGASGVYGGNVSISGGTGTTSNGLVILSTPTFSTTSNDGSCYTGGSEVAASCTIAQSSVNNSAAVLVGFTVDGQTATLPSPSITTAGRVVYVTASNLSKDFTLSVNGGGTGNQVAMRKNTSATMIWNGSAWTAAGASSSTTMQAAYDNTLQSAGGAELVVSKTSSTNGLTIRDSLTNSVDGTLLSVQTKSAAGLFQVNSNVTEYVSNAGAETAGASAATFPSNTWSAIGATTVSRNTTTNNNSIPSGQASVSVATPATTQTGVKNSLTTTLGTKQNYNVSFTARLDSGTFTDMNVYYSADGTTASVLCKATQAIATSVWTKVNCSFTAPTSGITSSNALFIRQTSGTARTFYIDNLSVTIAADYNYATDGPVSDSTNFATNWSSVSGSTVTRTTSAGHDASDSAQTVTAATSGQGVRNKLAINPLPSTLYRITVRAASSNAFTDFTIRYSRDGGTSFATCVDYNTQTLSTSTSSFTEVTCYILTDSTAATDPYVYFTQGSAVARTFYVDAFSMNLNTNTTPNVQIGGGSNGGPTTLFTLDRGASAPISSNNDALLGSMYYDTTIGKLQCYEADGWGSCGSSPGNVITISPEYTNAVMHGTGVGTMVSDICSDTFNINDGSSSQPTICGTNETYNFYRWTSPQATAQTYSIYVTYQLPSTFKDFSSGRTSLMGRTDSSNSTVEYQVYRNVTGSGITACGSTIAVSSGSASSWQTGTASGAADPSTCGFAAGNSIVFKINVIASQNASAYVGNLNFTFNNQ